MRSGDSSRGRNNLVQPMGMARFDRSDSEKFSASMDAREFSGDLLSPRSANGSIVVERELLADSLVAIEGSGPSSFGTSQCEVARDGIFTDSLAAMEDIRPSSFRSDSGPSQVCFTPTGTPTGCEQSIKVRDAGIHGKIRVDCAKDRFASGRVPHETGAVSPSVMAENRGMEERFDSHSEKGASVGEYAGGRLANESSWHKGSTALPSVSTRVDQGAGCSFFNGQRARCEGIAGLMADMRDSRDVWDSVSIDCGKAIGTVDCRAGDGTIHGECVDRDSAAGVDRNLATCDGARESVSLVDNVYSERLAPDQFYCLPGAVPPTDSVDDPVLRPLAFSASDRVCSGRSFADRRKE